MLVTEQFIQSLVRRYGKQKISTDGGGTWYPQACKFLKIEHIIYIRLMGKTSFERTIQYVKDRTECFDDYFICRKERCKLKHVMKWLLLFVHMYNKEIIEKVKTGKRRAELAFKNYINYLYSPQEYEREMGFSSLRSRYSQTPYGI
jgi:hypothetical protein